MPNELNRWRSTLLLLGFLSVSIPAAAADLGSAPAVVELPHEADRWAVQFTPYAWLTFLNGDSTIKGRTTEFDLNPRQVLSHLESLPWMSYTEARKGPLALYNDVFFANLGISGSGVRARDFGPISTTTSISASLNFKEAVVEVGGAYQIAHWATGSPTATGFTPSVAFDVLAGVRYWYQDLAVGVDVTKVVSIGALTISGGRAIARGGSVDWVDPVVGLRYRNQIAPGQEILLRGDIGGFDVGSKFSWNLLGAYNFDFLVRDGVKYSGMLGYRLLDVNYTQGEGTNKYGYDVLQHGPVLGLTVNF